MSKPLGKDVGHGLTSSRGGNLPGDGPGWMSVGHGATAIMISQVAINNQMLIGDVNAMQIANAKPSSSHKLLSNFFTSPGDGKKTRRHAAAQMDISPRRGKLVLFIYESQMKI